MDLVETLRLQLMWLRCEDGGKRANLEDANLEDADLGGANMRGADLRVADMTWANLGWANLGGAKLREADLREADLRWANLEGADMREADLRWANLREANLREADLEGANLDYAAWPLWCGSFDAKADRRLAAQLAYHFCRIDFGDDAVCLVAQDALVTLANEFHRVGENGIPPIKERGSANDET